MQLKFFLLESITAVMTSLKPIEINFDGRVVASDFDRKVNEAANKYRMFNKEPRHVVLNFRETTFIDIVSTQYITAFVAQAKKRNWLVSLRPPSSKRVRDFWRHWDFPNAFRDATDIEFSSLLSGPDRKILMEPQTSFRSDGPLFIYYPDLDNLNDTKIANNDGKPIQIGHGRSKNFFGFVTQFLGDYDPINLAEHNSGAWTIHQVRDVLDQYIPKSKVIPSHIIFEAFFNAVKHPEATLVQTVSWKKELAESLDGEAPDDQGFFNFVFWDNGDSIDKTLQDVVDRGENVREEYSREFDQMYRFVFVDLETPNRSYSDNILSRVPLNRATPKEIVFAASIFPGVTSKKGSIVHGASDALRDMDLRLTDRGMGLFVLVDAVVNIIGGEVSFRTGRYFMNVKKVGEKTNDRLAPRIKIKVIQQPNSAPPFLGNQIWIRLKSRANSPK